MLEHLMNCHGEWNALMAALASVPIAGTWIKIKVRKGENHESR